MRRFEYVKPTSVAEATSFLAAHADDSAIMGGGTATVVMLRMGVLRPTYVVDLGGIADLRNVTANGSLRIGALTPIRAVERDARVQGAYPLLAEAAGQVANVRVRNVATVGGTVAYGEPQTDTPVALTALQATVHVAGPNGSRAVPIGEFYRAAYETVLDEGEIVVAVEVPRPAKSSAGCHVKFTIGSPENKPVANVSSQVALGPDGKCTAATVVIGAIGATPHVASAAAGLIGEAPGETLIRNVAAAAANETSPLDDIRGPAWYKQRIARVLVERSLTCALQKLQA